VEFFCRMATAGAIRKSRPRPGFSHPLRNCRAYAERDSRSAAALRVNGVEGERGFPRSADTGNDGDSVMRISTLTFFRLWTRAPRTRMDSCSGWISFVVWVISLVAKASLDTRLARTCLNFKLYDCVNRSKPAHFDRARIPPRGV